jgi:glycosyltransferase involved in cell wall biosynthesis
MVSTPGDGSCGIGTYTCDLIDGIDSIAAEIEPIPQDDRSLRNFVRLAVRASRAAGDVIHVQHEYGLFRRDGSQYPGVMGVVFFPLLYLLSSLRSQKIVITLHSVIQFEPDEAPFSVRLYLLLMHKLMALCSAHLIFLSPDCASKFQDDIDLESEDFTLLSHGVNTDVSPSISQDEAKRAFGFESDEKVVAIPGFMRPPKGHDIFIEVARALPEYEFMIAGGARPKGADFEFAESVAADAPDNVTITGVLDEEDYWTALAAPDLALLPYRVVSQSGTFNACATRELPVLASDAEYFTRIQSTWGAPETVDISETSAIVTQVKELLENTSRRHELAEIMAAYKEANSFEQVGKDHLRIYQHLRNGTRGKFDEVKSAPESTPTVSASSSP